MAARPEAAVIVERACKYYGNKDKPVLDHLNMKVDRGTIYGLLGPSGCGKTTLLSCIVGRRKLNSGDVWVLGGRPGEKGSGVPGPRVGYMPQDIALVAEFSVRDAIYYFGRIYGMKPDKLSERFEFLRTLLDLPSGRRFIKTLSGGQQRRVSLAAALVHEPELLILDEPTVGLDPVLRERIWEFLVERANAGTAVIITTHYIDETKQAHKIGLLRDGQFLAEESPAEILRQYECDTLEEAFFKLALRQHQSSPRRSIMSSSPDVIPDNNGVSVSGVESRSQSREDFSVINNSTDMLTTKEKPKNCGDTKRSRYKAVFIKNVQQFSRHPGGLIFSLAFPIIQVVAFFSAIGHDPYDLKLAVVNDEAAFSPLGLSICNNKTFSHVNFPDEDTCDMYMLSCWFLEEMENRKLFQVPFNKTEDAKNAVGAGKYYAALHFPQHFSEALSVRIREGMNDDDEILDNSTVKVWMDMTDHQVSNFVKTQLYMTYEDFTKRAMRACNREEHVAQLPVNFIEPVYGKKEPDFIDYSAPGVMITIVFFLATLSTSTLMISDRLEGVWERSAVAGVRPPEMLQVHITLQSFVIVLQTVEMMLLAFYGYKLPSEGSLVTCGLLIFLQGIGGMCYGFLLSVLCPTYTISFFVSTGSFYPMIILCGILWPLEGMPAGLRAFALCLPFTIPTASLRDLMQKGSSFTDPAIYNGFIVTIAWIIGMLIIMFLRLRFKKS